jgi:hypothetical protein
VVAEAIEERHCELFVAEDLDPLQERQIGGDDSRAAFKEIPLISRIF